MVSICDVFLREHLIWSLALLCHFFNHIELIEEMGATGANSGVPVMLTGVAMQNCVP